VLRGGLTDDDDARSILAILIGEDAVCAERPPLATDAPVFPRLAKQALCEIEALLGFRQFLLDVLDGVFKRLEPCRDLG
jgi:hypothetical protein